MGNEDVVEEAVPVPSSSSSSPEVEAAADDTTKGEKAAAAAAAVAGGEGDAVLKLNTTFTDDNVPTVLSKLRKWGDYASYGDPVIPSRFIPMKTPLSPSLLHNQTFESVLTLPNFLAEQSAAGRTVGLVIDLSNHDCLYLDGMPPHLERVHVRNVAKSIPNVECTSEVIAVANEFWSRKPDEYVAIHCAYGFNRTGFVLCCYLIEACGLSADEALTNFAAARSPQLVSPYAPGVKHEKFKEALRWRYPTPGCAPVAVEESSLPRTESDSNVALHTQNETLDLGDMRDVTAALCEALDGEKKETETETPPEAAAEVAGAGVGANGANAAAQRRQTRI